MGFLTDLASSIDSMMHSFNVSPNFLCVLILFVAIYVLAFLFSALPSSLLALINISARYVHRSKDTWLSPDAFDATLNTLFVITVAPIVIGTARAIVAGHVIAALLIALAFTAAIYHGVFVGRTIAEYRRLPRLWDLVDEVLPM